MSQPTTTFGDLLIGQEFTIGTVRFIKVSVSHGRLLGELPENSLRYIELGASTEVRKEI